MQQTPLQSISGSGAAWRRPLQMLPMILNLEQVSCVGILKLAVMVGMLKVSCFYWCWWRVLVANRQQVLSRRCPDSNHAGKSRLLHVCKQHHQGALLAQSDGKQYFGIIPNKHYGFPMFAALLMGECTRISNLSKGTRQQWPPQ
jgi:hypothetical protein